MGDPAFPITMEKLDAQLNLAVLYSTGDGVERDPDLACGLAAIARHISATMFNDQPMQIRAQRTRDDLCSGVNDMIAAMRLASCPRFGIVSRTADLGSGAFLTINRNGWRVEGSAGINDGEWEINCGDVVASMRLRRVAPPAGSRLHPRQLLELFVWHQSHRDDGTIGNRSLEWRIGEVDEARGEVKFVDGAGVLVEDQASIWPMPAVPAGVRGGATFRMTRSGAVRWRFERAPQLGTGVIEPVKR